jgi:hypothetical protein
LVKAPRGSARASLRAILAAMRYQAMLMGHLVVERIAAPALPVEGQTERNQGDRHRLDPAVLESVNQGARRCSLRETAP